MSLVRYALITTLAFSAVAIGCGDDDGDKTMNLNDGGTSDAGDTDPESLIDAGEPAELPATDSQRCMDANAADFTPYEEADCQTYGEDESGAAVCGSCWSQSEAKTEGYCAGFFCNWTEDQILCQMDRPAGACHTEADLELGCDSSLQDAVAFCAREAQKKVLTGELTQDETPAYTRACSREELPDVVSPECLTCYVDSAACARDNCLAVCLSGDTPACDQCREDKGCTPAFFKCTGLPDPQQVNPNGSAR